MKCKVCNSKYVDEIDKRLAAREFTGETLDDIAKDYRKISYSSLQRHTANCLGNKPEEPEDEHEPSDIELEDLRDKALEHYRYAIDSGNTKLANEALGHIVKLEELISRRDDRALVQGKGDEVIEIEILWSEDLGEDGKPIPCYQRCPYAKKGLMQFGEYPELPPGDDEVIIPEYVEPVGTIDDWKALAEASKPTHLIKNDTGEIIGIDTPTGKIWKGPEPKELPLDEEDRDRGVTRRLRMPDGTLIEDISSFKPSSYH